MIGVNGRQRNDIHADVQAHIIGPREDADLQSRQSARHGRC